MFHEAWKESHIEVKLIFHNKTSDTNQSSNVDRTNKNTESAAEMLFLLNTFQIKIQ